MHAGESANSGHYYFNTVCPPYKTTRLAYRSNNDDRPQPISMETLIRDVNNAYMLAYQKAAEQPGEQPAVCVPPPPPPAADVPAPTEKTQHKAKEAADTTTQNATQDEKYFKDLLVQRDAILDIKAENRSPAEKSEYTKLAKNIQKLKDRFPHIDVKPPSKAKTGAEKVAALRKDETFRNKERERDKARLSTPEALKADRARKATDENKAKDCARKATPEYMAKDCARKATPEYQAKTAARLATPEYKAADLQRKTAKKANVKVKARDGLKAGLILSGKFGVETNSLGAMDKVSRYHNLN